MCIYIYIYIYIYIHRDIMICVGDTLQFPNISPVSCCSNRCLLHGFIDWHRRCSRSCFNVTVWRPCRWVARNSSTCCTTVPWKRRMCPMRWRMFLVGGLEHIFPYIGINHSNWLIFFRGGETTNHVCIMIDHIFSLWISWIDMRFCLK